MEANIQNFTVGGVYVEHVAATKKRYKNPMLFVHGGAHGSWTWHNFMAYFAREGWDCYALNWFNHNNSKALSQKEFGNRSLADVTKEISIVVKHLKQTPVLIAHSMGALTAQKYVETQPVASLVLVAPTGCKAVGNPWIPIPVNKDKPWGPPPFFMARFMFFTDLNPEQTKQYYAMLRPESSQAIKEVSGRAAVAVNAKKVQAHVAHKGIYVISGGKDSLVPPRFAYKTARYYGAELEVVPKQGHDALLLGRHWRSNAGKIKTWLEKQGLEHV